MSLTCKENDVTMLSVCDGVFDRFFSVGDRNVCGIIHVFFNIGNDVHRRFSVRIVAGQDREICQGGSGNAELTAADLRASSDRSDETDEALRTVFAQCGMSIPVLGTTHSSSFFGPVPCTRKLSDGEIFGKYETEIGRVIAELFTNETVASLPAVLVHSHGPLTWGSNAIEAVERSVLLEKCAMMAWHTLMLNPFVKFQDSLLKKHNV